MLARARLLFAALVVVAAVHLQSFLRFVLRPVKAYHDRYLCLYVVNETIESQGVTFAVSDGSSPSAFTAIANIVNFKGPGGSASVIDITNLDSLAKEKRMGLPDEGQFTFELNYNPGNAQHTQLRNARKNRTRLEFRLTLTDSATTVLAFYGYVLGFELGGSVDAVVKTSVSIEIDGVVTEV